MNTQPVDPKLLTARIIEGAPKHSVIYSAAAGLDGKIYLGLSAEMDFPGTFARLIAYDPEADAFEDIADLARLIPEASEPLRHPHSKLHTATCIGKDGKVYAATHMTAPPADEDYYHFWHAYNDPERCFKGSHLIIHNPYTKETRDFGIVSPKGGCRWMTYNPEREELYLTSFLTAHFMVVRLKTGEVKDLGRISQYDFMGPCYSACGAVFTTDCRGFLLRYDPKTEAMEKLPVKIPNECWRGSDGNGVFHFLPGPDGVKLYGAGPIGKRLFEYDPTVGRHGKLRDLGTAWGEDRMDAYSETPMIRTMTVAPDGRVYLAAKYSTSQYAVEGAKPSLMESRYNIVGVDPKTGEKLDYGLMQAQGLPPILNTVAATAEADGTMYFATWKVKRHLPLQLILFHPEGVKQPHQEAPPLPPPEDAGPNPDAPTRYAYHIPSRRDNSVFVTEGTVVARELGEAGRVPFIPRNECAVTAVAQAQRGAVFGATSGRRSHLFCITPLAKRFVRLAVLGEGPTECRHLVQDSAGRLFIGTMGAEGRGGRLLMYDAPARDLWLRRYDDMDRGEFSGLPSPPAQANALVENLGEPVPGEGVYAMTVNREANQIYGLTWPGGKFFVHDIGARETQVRDIFDEHIAKRYNISRAIHCREGIAYFSGHHGRLIAYIPELDAFEDTGMKLPVGAGREYLNAAACFAETQDGLVYGATQADGLLFRWDPQTGDLENLGKPTSESRIADLAIGNDGDVWGLCGGQGQLTHLFRHDTLTGNMKDCGLIRAKMPKTWVVHKAEIIATGMDGELYIGETDAISHLIVYCPPVHPHMPWEAPEDEA